MHLPFSFLSLSSPPSPPPRPTFHVLGNVSAVPKLKEVNDVLGGAAAWENVDTTEGVFYMPNGTVESVGSV